MLILRFNININIEGNSQGSGNHFFMDEPAFPQGKWEGFTVVYGNHNSVAEESDVGMDLTEANRVPGYFLGMEAARHFLKLG